MNDTPDCVWSTVLSRISLKNCTCGAISLPYAAVAIRQPPPFSSCCATTHIPSLSTVPSPHNGSGSGSGSGYGSTTVSTTGSTTGSGVGSTTGSGVGSGVVVATELPLPPL